MVPWPMFDQFVARFGRFRPLASLASTSGSLSLAMSTSMI